MKLKRIRLLGVLDRIAPSLSEQPGSSRIRIDSRGGLAYNLFDSDWKLSIPAAQSFREMDALSLYFNALKAYGEEAEQCAKEYKLGLVVSEKGKLMFPNFDFSADPVYRMGIGKAPVTSFAELDRFVGMFFTEYGRLEERYKKVRESAENLKSLR
ncbi:MAG: hypothetical protein Q7S55_02210 [Nanoarchaeota archaeon]|nr:hypothetical protein [Nanoarchaeota archaeon]